MARRPIVWLIATTIFLANAAGVQSQVIQLPTVRQFSVQTTVLVPDRGGMLLGGVNTSSARSATRGPLLQQGVRSSGASASSLHITAQIIDLEAMDRAVLAAAARRRAARGSHRDPQIAGRAAQLTRYVENNTRRAAATPSPRRQAERDTLELWERAKQAAAAHRWGASRIFLQMAQRRDAGPMRERIDRALTFVEEQISPPPRVAARSH